MNKKWIITAVFLCLSLALMPLQAFAMEGVSAELPFTVENTTGTVVIEAVDGAPLPEQTEFAGVTEGKFILSFEDPGDYAYKVYQKPGTEAGVTYDKTIYDAVVSVFVNEEDEPYTVVTLSIAGDTLKPEKIKFTNLLPTPSGGNDPSTGDNSRLWLWILLSAVSLAGILLLASLNRKPLDE